MYYFADSPLVILKYLWLQSLDQKVEKNSPSLGRQAIYSQKSRMTRLPSYLTVHMVRFAWRQDIGKKTKIMVSSFLPSLFRTKIFNSQIASVSVASHSGK